ncbi:unnamed protein product [Absidia cylindrospora]
MTDITEGPIAIIDMGSNGIQFGIVSTLSRHLPVTYEERAPISLLEVQGEDKMIPPDTIEQVVNSFRRFKALCEDAQVPDSNIRVIATEATRVAANAKEFLDAIYQATGWSVKLLSKQEEALISASGIVESFYSVKGLTSDCGGGSVELSYVISGPNNDNGFQAAQQPVSLPYGAMALKKRLAQCGTKDERHALYDEVKTALQQALHDTQPPDAIQHDDGYEIYMSGGGFRALGYLSMARKSHKVSGNNDYTRQPDYPIPMINGYTISGKALKKLVHRYNNKKADDVVRQVQGFRISRRRAEMMPAICFLVSAMVEVIPIRRVHFSEGGVRQGICYQMLAAHEQSKDPLFSSVKMYTSSSDFALRDEEFDAIYDILKDALPEPYLDPNHPLQLCRLLPAAIYLANLTSHYPKESRAYVAFHMSLPSGPLANVPGLTHKERATLAILLAYRQGGAVPDPIFYKVQSLVGKKGISVCKYLGRVMELVFAVSPLQPGIGLIRSGLTFKTIAAEDEANNDSDDGINYDQDGATLQQYEQHSRQHMDRDKDDSGNADDDDDEGDGEGDDNDDDNGNETTTIKNFYPPMKLCIQLPPDPSILLNAPAIMSLMEKLDKKVNTRKFDMDGEEKKIKCPSLFSVDVSCRSLE